MIRARGLLAVSASLILLAWSVHAMTPQAASVPPELGVLRLFSATGLAHGCPIDPHHFLTSRHVAIRYPPSGASERVSVIWSDGQGHLGSAWTEDYDLRRDLALMRTDTPLSSVYPVAQRAPAVGSRVRVLEYDYRTGLSARVRSSRIVTVLAMHLVLSEPGSMGSSGSCVFDETGQVVGIFQWTLEPPGGGRRYGVASGVWGDWHRVDWMPSATLPPAF